jgi:DNA-binding GntR family transcriptional regulator
MPPAKGADITPNRAERREITDASSEFADTDAPARALACKRSCKPHADNPIFIDKMESNGILSTSGHLGFQAGEPARSIGVEVMTFETAGAAKPANAKEVAGGTLTEQVLARLREDIVNGHLVASKKLRMHDLSRRYGVGASPLREALSRLTSDGLVIAETNRGFRVAPLSLADFEDIVDNRRRNETLALKRSIESGDDVWEGHLVAAFHQLRKFEATYRPNAKLVDPTREWERRHRTFHQALIAACPSPWLLHFNRLLVTQFDRYRRHVVLEGADARRGREQEDELVQVALARQAGRAARLLDAHIADFAVSITEQLKTRLT